MPKLLASLSYAQRIMIVSVVLLAGAGLYGFARWRSKRDFRPIYSSLATDDAAAVVQRLKESAIDYQLSPDGTTILVPSAHVPELRLTLAAAGLPRNGRIGFELFDKTNFGATEFAEQVNYRRALEGELERSIVCISAIEQARVHLTFPKESVYLESRQPAKASVLVKLRLGARLSPQNVAAIANLVASAVEGLAPESVSILDMQGTLLNRPRRQPAGEDGPAGEAALEYRQAMERDLVNKIASTLEPVVGSDKFRASAALDCDITSGEQSEETFDPSKSVMLTSQKSEESSATASAEGVPGTASNLPRPSSRPSQGSGGVSRLTESITYQTSRTVRRIRLPQGAVKRVSVAVLVDHDVKFVRNGNTTQRLVEPPSPEKLKVIRDLVSAAAGLNAERGDQLIVESLPFDSTVNSDAPASVPAAPPAVPPGPLGKWKEHQWLIVGASGGVVLLLLLALAAMKLMKRKRTGSAIGLPQIPGPGTSRPAVSGSSAAPLSSPEEAFPELPAAPPKKTDVVAGRLREAIKKAPAASAQVLRGWLTEDEE
jgi:flagellar M-ring protein FliF